MTFLHKFFAVLLVVLFAEASLAQSGSQIDTEQADVSLVVSSYDEYGIEAGVKFVLAPGWKIYWRQPGDVGFPVEASLLSEDNITEHSFFWPFPKRDIVDFSGSISESYVYEEEVIFPLYFSVTDPSQPVTLSYKVSYALCKDVCIPAQADLSVDVVPGYSDEEASAEIIRYKAKLPQKNGENGLSIGMVSLRGGDFLEVVTYNVQGFKSPDIFVEGNSDLGFYAPQVTLSNDRKQAVFLVPVRNFTGKVTTLAGENLRLTLTDRSHAVELMVDGASVGQVTNDSVVSEGVTLTLYVMLLFGFIGGLILNIMPCVLPVLSIKLLGVVKYGGSSRFRISLGFWLTALGIVSSFMVLATVVAVLQSAGKNVGWGFHFQEPLFIIALVVVLSLFAANLWGLFEFRMPGFLAGVVEKGEHYEGSLVGSFMTGAFATVLATPCTAPFLGTVVGFALAQGTYEIFVTFFAMGVGLASPYIFFSLFPGMIKKLLPKPGAWMVIVKHVMGALLALTAIWLIWVISNQLGMVAALLLLVLMVVKNVKLWLAKHVPFLAKKIVRIPFLVVVLILAFVLPLAVSKKVENGVGEGSLWQDFSREAIAVQVSLGKVVFVDVTADWCLTCKANKIFVLYTDDIEEALKADDVVAMQADWTNKNEDIAEYLQDHGRFGIPFNVVYGPGAPEGIVLSEVLSVEEVLEAIKQARSVSDSFAFFVNSK